MARPQRYAPAADKQGEEKVRKALSNAARLLARDLARRHCERELNAESAPGYDGRIQDNDEPPS